MPSKKYLLIAVYIAVLAIPVITWIRGFNATDKLHLFMHSLGLLAFTLLFCQLVIGAFMNYLRPVFGSKILRWHIVQGTVAFCLAWLHPIMYAILVGLRPLLLLFSWTTPYYFLGLVGLILLTIAVTAGALRTQTWLAKYWRWIHRLNYLTLAAIYLHSLNVGTDTHTFPMILLYYLIPPVFVYSLYYKMRPYTGKFLERYLKKLRAV